MLLTKQRLWLTLDISRTRLRLYLSLKMCCRIFAPLVTTKAKGMGMGLVICKRIVEAHDGRIIIDSQVGWDPIKVTLPIKPSKTELAAIAPSTSVVPYNSV